MLFFCAFSERIVESEILYAIYPVLYSLNQNINVGITVGILSYSSPLTLALIPYYYNSEDTEYLDINYEVNKFIETSLLLGIGFNNPNNIDD
jgi:hypothetical protein